MAIFRVKSVKKRQFFALNLLKFTPGKKNLHGYARGARDKYQVCVKDSAEVTKEVVVMVVMKDAT